MEVANAILSSTILLVAFGLAFWLALSKARSKIVAPETDKSIPLIRPMSKLYSACQRLPRARHLVRAPDGPPRRRAVGPSGLLRVRRITHLTMSNSAVFFVPAARCCTRVLLASCRTRFAETLPVTRLHQLRRASEPAAFRLLATTDSLTPDEGWMERRQAHSLTSVAPAKRDPLSRGDRDLSRRSTVAMP